MGFEDYVSENEAVALSGVSPVTLNRFAEAGYLRIEADNDGLRLFSKRELLDVFGIQEQVIDNTVAKLEREAFDFPLEDSKDDNSALEESEDEEISATDEDAEIQEQQTVQEKESGKLIQFPSESDSEPEKKPKKSPENSSETPQKAKTPSQQVERETPKHNHIIEALEAEKARLENITKMQDRVLDMRESEIADLKEQRDWLRARIEKLEEKGDRDQLLLLSETQVLRQLIVQQHQKSSPLRGALEWLGLVRPKPAPPLPSSTIELQKK